MTTKTLNTPATRTHIMQRPSTFHPYKKYDDVEIKFYVDKNTEITPGMRIPTNLEHAFFTIKEIKERRKGNVKGFDYITANCSYHF